ncbi:MAG: transglutaminase family protein [Sphingopyxis sp.]
MQMTITHRTSYHFPAGAARLLLLLKLWPEPHAGQVVRNWLVSVNDAPIFPGARTEHGENIALWSASASPGEIAILATGIVEAEDKSGLVTGLTVRPNPLIFLRPTDKTRADKAIRELMPSPPGTGATIAWLHSLMQVVHESLRYVTGSTNVHTSAIDALKDGAGVCQDHAHLFIAAARAHGVPARYVCGYLLADGDHGDLHETHAWAESWIEGMGWVAFDPSSGICTTERYVRLTTGFDASDAAPIRGHATGGGALGVIADVRIARTFDAALDKEGDASGAETTLQMQQQ